MNIWEDEFFSGDHNLTSRSVGRPPASWSDNLQGSKCKADKARNGQNSSH